MIKICFRIFIFLIVSIQEENLKEYFLRHMQLENTKHLERLNYNLTPTRFLTLIFLFFESFGSSLN